MSHDNTVKCDVHFKRILQIFSTQGSQTTGIFYADEMIRVLNEAMNIQFSCTFQTDANRFVQLWTMFVAVGRHMRPEIYSVMTSKSQGLYSAILNDLVDMCLKFSQSFLYPIGNVLLGSFYKILSSNKVYGCWLHSTQQIWSRIQKLKLSQSYR